jgi:hypothetical protein
MNRKPEVKPANATQRSSATCYVQRRQPVMSNASKSFTSMQATRSHRRDVNGMVGQRSTFNQMRTFLREICVPLQPADPLKSTASAALQNGLMFQPHSEDKLVETAAKLIYAGYIACMIRIPFCLIFQQFC